MTDHPDAWKKDPEMPRLFLVVYDAQPDPVWANVCRSSFDITKHLDSKIEEARLRGLLLEVSLRFVDPGEAGFGPVTPEGELDQLEDEAK
jgi:hypothetical protein